jgi:poly-beta-1,6-N-acetyl-D-glucosamine synthase
MLLMSFLAAAAVLWASVFGYVAVLLVLAIRRGSARSASAAVRPTDDELPSIAVVVPVRNEETLIAAKLGDLRRTDYPSNRMVTIVVDGGSTDRTAALVEAERAHGDAIELVRVEGAGGKAAQLNAIVGRLHHDAIIITDVDAILDPACIRNLVDVLRSDPTTAMVGTRIRPATRLLEERMHWWLLNSLWWLEGEALGAAAVSGVCYAIRPSAFVPLPADCTAEDIRLALGACARGYSVRLCRTALATEVRVPQTVRDFLRFRRRRGCGYVHELLRARVPSAPLRWHVVRLLRLYHFLVMPLVASAALASGLALCATSRWYWPTMVGVAFAVPVLAALFASTTLGGEGRRWWRLSFAAGRLAGLTWLSLLSLPRAALPTLIEGE